MTQKEREMGREIREEEREREREREHYLSLISLKQKRTIGRHRMVQRESGKGGER